MAKLKGKKVWFEKQEFHYMCLTDAEPGVSCPKNLEIGFVSFADSFASVFCFNRIFITRNI